MFSILYSFISFHYVYEVPRDKYSVELCFPRERILFGIFKISVLKVGFEKESFQCRTGIVKITKLNCTGHIPFLCTEVKHISVSGFLYLGFSDFIE